MEDKRQKWIFVKGAPEKLLEMIAVEERAIWEAEIAAHAKRGERLLAAAAKPVNDERQSIDHEELAEGFKFLGVAGVIDPAREEVIDSIAQCQKAGIRVKMITGDHKVTAMAIGAKLGIGNGGKVNEGLELDAKCAQQLAKAAVACDIFARTSPASCSWWKRCRPSSMSVR